MAILSNFLIPLNELDNGVRTGWCTGKPAGQPWYTNENIYLTGSLSRTEVQVGQAAMINVGIQGLQIADLPGGGNLNSYIQNVQVWVCYGNTSSPGRTTESLVLPSWSKLTPTPGFAGSAYVLCSNPILDEYQSNLGPYYFLAAMGPWSPTDDDLMGHETDGTVHCCIVANCSGTGTVTGGGQEPVGTVLSSVDEVDICNNQYQGQCNIAIVPFSSHKRRAGSLVQEFGFLAASVDANQPTHVILEVTPVPQQSQVDRAVLGSLKSGPYRDLPLQPASSGLKRLRLTKNTYKLKGHLAGIIREAERIVEEAIEAVVHPFPRNSRLRLHLPPGGVQPLLLEIELDAALTPGSVHAFDITQTEADGRRGGIRLGAVVVP